MPAERVILATTNVINGVRLTRQSLIDVANIINGERAVRQGLEHDPHFVPLGKARSAEVVDLDEVSALVLVSDDTHSISRRVHESSKTTIVELTFPNDVRPFVLYEESQFQTALTVSVDWTNFDKIEDFEEFVNSSDGDSESEVSQPMLRRSLVPDPLIQFAVNYPEITAALTWIAWRGEKFLRYTVDQTLRKAGDGISDEISGKLKKWIGSYNKLRAPHEHDVTSCIIINSKPQINLLTRSRQIEDDTEMGIESLVEQLELHQDLMGEADSIAFARKSKEEEWGFLYLTTKSGNLIAKEECYLDTLNKREEIAKTFPVCICMEHRETKEERHYETTAIVTSISDDGRVQLKFGSYPSDIDEWEMTALSLQTRRIEELPID